MTDSEIGSFRLRLYAGARRDEPEWETSGNGVAWQDTLRVRVPGFDGSATVHLDELWSKALRDRCERLELPVVGLETIVKFGNTKQLRHDLTAVLEIDFAG